LRLATFFCNDNVPKSLSFYCSFPTHGRAHNVSSSSPFDRDERSSCGVGFVAARTGAASHAILQEALRALRCVEHRGACGADQVTGDGAGIMADIPFELLGYRRGEIAVANLFMPRDIERMKRSLEIFEATFDFYGLEILGYREIPTNPAVLGEEASRSMPAMKHAIIRRPPYCRTDASFDRLLYTAKQTVRSKQSDRGINKEFFFTSLSATTIVYKALTRADVLDRFYLDLQNPAFVTRFAVFHRRFSTNTSTTWDKAQPFRLIGHNGEINTIAGNRSRAFSREKSLGLKADQLVTHGGISDSGSLNEMVEALMYRSGLPQIEDILAIMMPPAHGQNDFYKFWSRAMEPWDGPAIILYSDGRSIGARLDRNGFRPSRWTVTEDTFYLSSEAGSFRLDESNIQRKGILHAGTGVKVDLASGRIHFRDAALSRENRDATFDPRAVPVGSLPVPDAGEPVSVFIKNLFTCTKEELERVLYPMIADGKEAIGSMGDTARPNVFSSEPRPFFDYFYQNFAQVTNPPLDYIREKNITDLRVFLGRRPNIFFAKDLLPLAQAIELPGPILSLGQMKFIQELARKSPSQSHIIPKTFRMVFDRSAGIRGFRPAVDALAASVLAAVEAGASMIILSDEDTSAETPPIPGLIALRAVVKTLNQSGLRLQTSVVVHSAEARTSHHIAALIGFGASAVCPYLALRIARNDRHESFQHLPVDIREKNYISALESGLLKIMSKSGISVVQSYMSAKPFTAIGLGSELMENFFPGNPTPLGGIGYEELAADVLEKTALPLREDLKDALLQTYQFREHARSSIGEKHALTAARARVVHRLVQEGADPEAQRQAYAEYVAMGSAAEPVNVRHLFDFVPAGSPLDLAAVEPAEKILRQFGAGAMSFGAVGAESQRDVIAAMKDLGGRSNSGEGGENPYYYVDGTTASTKQVASARFGVTAEYLIAGREMQIKIAQGAKPGEGGQLMSVKVDEDIARARHSFPHRDLISPPPLHDVYSIEDLKELIYELKQVHPSAEVSVKLVSGSGIGTIAVGVAKAGADIIYIAGGDGGTGAATLGSMKHAGLPWEFGLMEAHRALCENRLRGSVRLRTDGGLLTGKDVVIAAILGAEGFDFGKLLLVAEGCIMARICEKNTCPTGIATHDPKFKAKYRGNKEQVKTILRFVAEDVRGVLAALGVRSLAELVGRTDLLKVAAAHEAFVRERKLSLQFFLGDRVVPGVGVGVQREGLGPLNKQILDDARQALVMGTPLALSYDVTTADRGVLATLSGEIARRTFERRMRGELSGDPPPPADITMTFTGSAGQGFCAFLVEGIKVTLRGEANDSVCKSMSGGKVVIRPHPHATYPAEENAIIGHCALYGATGGALYVQGLAGDRFGVRNSGATAVVEGAGLHACEYMTRGKVAILGPVSHNVGAGMTGGVVYLRRDKAQMVNAGYLLPRPLDDADADDLRALIAAYQKETGSPRVASLLEQWGTVRHEFVRCDPRE
jgi:glutamate synthase domain-containing protein 2/glutamate synthase domain-containing protein 1/glutamate synthase domain-containing protein 3